MKRADLKQIVKECLIEILRDGINVNDSGYDERNFSAMHEQKISNRPQEKLHQRKDPLDEKAPPLKQNVKLQSNVNSAVKMMTDDPLMQGIFADTIATVQKQNASGHGQGAGLMSGRITSEAIASMNSIQPPADRHAAVVANNNIDELFEGSDRWAKLAFMG